MIMGKESGLKKELDGRRGIGNGDVKKEKDMGDAKG